MIDNETFHDFIGYYSLCLFAFSTITSLMSVILCLTKHLRVVPTFIILAYTAGCDAVALCFWNVDHYLHQFYDYTEEDLGILSCRFVTFFQCLSLQGSSWLLVVLAVERYLSVKVKTWRVSYFNSKKAAILGGAVLGIVFIINFHLLFTINYDTYGNLTILGACVSDDNYQLWMQAHNYLYSVVPFCFLLFANSLLISEVFCRKNSQVTITTTASQKRKAMTVTVLTMTTSFLVLTFPQMFARGYFVYVLSESPSGLSIMFFCDCLAFTYHGSNFVLLYFTNKKFKETVLYVFRIGRSRIFNSSMEVTHMQTTVK